MILIIGGVSGAGKTTIGRQLAEALGVSFYDADDFHPASNIAKMASGISLDDDDRQPWLEALAEKLSAWQTEGGAVLACSALKESYRATLRSRCSERIRWVFLWVSEAELGRRLTSRKGHFADQRLLRSQLKTIEKPDYGWIIDADCTPRELVKDILKRLGTE